MGWEKGDGGKWRQLYLKYNKSKLKKKKRMRSCYPEEEENRTVPGRGPRYVQGHYKHFSMIARS